MGVALGGIACAAGAPESSVAPGLVLDRVDFDGAGLSGHAAAVALGADGAVDARGVQGTLADPDGGVWAVRAGTLRGGSAGWVAGDGVEAVQGALRVAAGTVEASLGPGHTVVSLLASGGVRLSAPGRGGEAETAFWSAAGSTVTLRDDAVWRVGREEHRGDVLVVRLPEGAVCAACPPVERP